MFRKLIIVVLTLGAVGCLGLGAASLSKALCWWPISTDDGQVYMDIVRFQASVHVVTYAEECHAWYRRQPELAQQVRENHAFGGHGQLYDLDYLEFVMRCTKFACAYYLAPPGCLQYTDCMVGFPLWGVALLLLLYPAASLIRGPLRRRHRRRRGLCLKCSYDLTGNASGVCPECGTEAPAP